MKTFCPNTESDIDRKITFSCLPLGLLRLNLLDLSDNFLSTVPKHLPPSLQQLYLSNNSLSGLDEDSFSALLNLKYLRLSHCRLQSPSLHPQVFNLSSLVELDLAYNNLTSVPTVPTTLQYLYMEANYIKGDVWVQSQKLRVQMLMFHFSSVTQRC